MSGASGSRVQTSPGTCLHVGARRVGRASDAAGEYHRARGGRLAWALRSPHTGATGVCRVTCPIQRNGHAPCLQGAVWEVGARNRGPSWALGTEASASLANAWARSPP